MRVWLAKALDGALNATAPVGSGDLRAQNAALVTEAVCARYAVEEERKKALA